MGKRANKRAAGKPRAKKVRTDPILASIANALFKVQYKQSLDARSAALEAAVAAENAQLEGLTVSEAELSDIASAAEVALIASREESTFLATKRCLEEATVATTACWNVLTRRRAEHKATETFLAHAASEKVSLEVAFSQFRIKPVTFDADGRPQHMTLSPEVRDSSWLRGFEAGDRSPNSAFFEGLHSDISSNISRLGATLVSETLLLKEQEAAVRAAEEQYEEKMALQQNAAAELEVAEKNHGDREAALSKAKQTVVECQAQIGAVRLSLEKAKMTLRAFQDGPLANFMASEAIVSAKAASSGA